MKPNLAIVTAFSPSYAPVAELTIPRMAAAAKSLGLPFYPIRLGYDGQDERPAGWMKIPHLRRLLDEYAALWWLDADVLLCRPILVHDLEAWFYTRDADLVISRDYAKSQARNIQHEEFGADVQVGSIFFRRTEWTLRLLDNWWGQTDLLHHPYAEQAALCRLLAKDSSRAAIDEAAEYNRWLREWKEGDATCHFAGIRDRFFAVREFINRSGGLL